MTISAAYKDQLIELHKSDDSWGTSGLSHLEAISVIIQAKGYKSVLDIGCGKGVLIKALKAEFPELRIQGYDPAVPEYQAKPEVADLVICTDVLEHIEPEFLMDFMEIVSNNCERELYAAISLVKAKAILPDGRNAHLIVQGADAWIDEITDWFANITIVTQSPRELVVRAL